MTAAIVLWNTVYLERATQGLTEAGKPVNTDLYKGSGEQWNKEVS
ncbi:hypothetical protein CFBP3840_P300038 (plasmid) [Pseudomonas syringae]|uniref:Uncharacterized protein n=1 Tax=Pseudomonas syringae TaxID=317 RepID=A0A2K4X3V8_PSESX|nr:hypothetical protein CFBP3840_P300038 [Pseudomonas syringae]